MNRLWTLLAVSGVFVAGFGVLDQPRGERYVLLLMGDTEGYLSPCGCTKPMTGGIRRRATAVRALTGGASTTVLENGGLIAGSGRQDHLKAEALAEALRHMNVSAVNLTPSEARLGPGLIQSLRNLGGEIFVQSNLSESPTNTLPDMIVHGLFLVGGVSLGSDVIARTFGERSIDNEAAARKLAGNAKLFGKIAVLMLAGGRDEAVRIAQAVEGLGVIQYRSNARPSKTPEKIGETYLVSPGEKGRHILRLVFEDAELRAYSPVELGPEYKDDETVSRVYKRYLAQVDKEKLLDQIPRGPSAKFVGNAACMKCHANAAKVWKKSQHSHALRTLIKEGHARDPDCVGCHVVGLTKLTGFKSVAATPQLANVGCESCHGPGAAHSAKPKFVKMGKVGAASCAPCHDPENSPNFDFQTYWKKIKH